MDDLNVQVLHGFGVKTKKIVKDKSCYICQTDKGGKVVRKSFDTAEHISFQHTIKEHLCRRGFGCTDRFTPSLSGEPYLRLDDDVYTMTDQLNYKQANFSDNREFERVITGVAGLHMAARGVRFAGRVYARDEGVVNAYGKSLAELRAIKKRLGSRKRLSDFDVLFLKNYDFYVERLETAVSLLEKYGMDDYTARAKASNSICHGAVKEENVLLDGDHTFIVNFSRASVAPIIFDLCDIIRRYAKCLPARYLPVSSILEQYDMINPLSSEERRLIYPLLVYPDKFVRICGQYYSKNRTWTPSAITNRMETTVGSKESYYAFIEQTGRL